MRRLSTPPFPSSPYVPPFLFSLFYFPFLSLCHIDSQSHMHILNHLFSHMDPQTNIHNHRSYNTNHKNISNNALRQEFVQREVRKGEEEEP
jgi:hypothetical protein